MRLPRWSEALTAFFGVVGVASGHSSQRSPVSHVSLVEDVRIGTPSRRVHANSDFDLTFRLRRQGESSEGTQYKLSLTPNIDLLMNGLRINHMSPEGVIVSTETMTQHDFKAYQGLSWIRTKSQGGEMEWRHAGWARLSVHQDGPEPILGGAFTIFNDAHHIMSVERYMDVKHAEDPLVNAPEGVKNVVFRDSDISPRLLQDISKLQPRDVNERALGRDGCSSDGLEFNTQSDHPVIRMLNTPAGVPGKTPWNGMSPERLFGIRKRQDDGSSFGGIGNTGGVSLTSTIGSTAGCPTKKVVALAGVAADCSYVSSFGGNSSAVRSNIIEQFNTASLLYERTFNITLGIQTLNIVDRSCPGTPPASALWNTACSDNVTIEDRLNQFSQWRGEQGNDGNAFWTLLSTCNTGSSVGLSWLGMLCQSEATAQTTQSGQTQYVSGANFVAKTSVEWKVIAHEIGHTMGAVHDCTSSSCANQQLVQASQCCPLSQTTCDAQGRYIMNPSTDDQDNGFSPCTVGNICSAFGRRSVNTQCLQSNKNVTTITENRCGNGIVEPGEDCDCGGTQGCTGNQCCDPTTCKFINNAVCDDSNEDCCTSCQFSPASTTCRASSGACDPEERCTGSSATCPDDTTLPDGQSCGSGGLACASGQCTSRDQQCKTVMGQFAGTGNDTTACDDSSCQISCFSPSLGGRNVCYSLQQNFLSGTPCAGSGKCQDGICRGGSVLGEVGSWISRNKPLVIGLAAGIGGLILLSLLTCCYRSIRRRSARKKARAVAPVYQTRRSSRQALAYHHYPPPVQQVAPPWQQEYFGGPSTPPPPSFPPRAHGGMGPGNLRREQSVRYA